MCWPTIDSNIVLEINRFIFVLCGKPSEKTIRKMSEQTKQLRVIWCVGHRLKRHQEVDEQRLQLHQCICGIETCQRNNLNESIG